MKRFACLSVEPLESRQLLSGTPQLLKDILLSRSHSDWHRSRPGSDWDFTDVGGSPSSRPTMAFMATSCGRATAPRPAPCW